MSHTRSPSRRVRPDASLHEEQPSFGSGQHKRWATARSATATVKAETIFGAMHGLESLTQLLDVRVGPGGAKVIPSAPVEISDAPRFSFRGVMIDSGRHFLPISHIKHVIEGAAMVKLNVIREPKPAPSFRRHSSD